MIIDTVSSQCIEEWKKNKRKNRNYGPDKGETLSQLRSRIVTLNVALLKRLREKESLLNRGIYRASSIPCKYISLELCREYNGIERERIEGNCSSTWWE